MLVSIKAKLDESDTHGLQLRRGLRRVDSVGHILAEQHPGHSLVKSPGLGLKCLAMSRAAALSSLSVVLGLSEQAQTHRCTQRQRLQRIRRQQSTQAQTWCWISNGLAQLKRISQCFGDNVR